ncbi:MAG TPA: flagellar assembly protein FliW [Pyrinomonadaceae bacterium]|nr:flagellar assembly protein FliW [Pyrinomonadaceae bacterium]
MPTIHIQGVDLSYQESSIITFDEGLIGFPGLKRMVIVRQSGIEPFLWLASLDDASVAFLVVDPRQLFPDYKVEWQTVAPAHQLGSEDDEAPLVLAMVLIAAEWKESSVNLRAPIFISPSTMRGMQFALSDSPYRLDEPFPEEVVAA